MARNALRVVSDREASKYPGNLLPDVLTGKTQSIFTK
jgi:hypothetical protein